MLRILSFEFCIDVAPLMSSSPNRVSKGLLFLVLKCFSLLPYSCSAAFSIAPPDSFSFEFSCIDCLRIAELLRFLAYRLSGAFLTPMSSILESSDAPAE